jgi:hypothetical protein
MSELLTYRDIWRKKPVLRAIYDDCYDRIAAACIPGLTVEIGGGIGNLKGTSKNGDFRRIMRI